MDNVMLAPDTIAYLLRKRALAYPRDTAYSFPEINQHLSWGMLWHEARLAARGLLQAGVQKGDAVAVWMTGRQELIVSMFAAACIGAVIVPLNTYSKKDELCAFLQSASPRVLIMGSEGHHLDYIEAISGLLREQAGASWLPRAIFVTDGGSSLPAPLRPYEDLLTLASPVDEQTLHVVMRLVTPADPLILLFTSGTVGAPKGVLRTTASFLSMAPKSTPAPRGLPWPLERLTDAIARRFAVMNLLPLYHLGGFGTIFTNLKMCNVRIVMLRYFHPSHAIDAIHGERCRVLIGTPYMVQRVLACAQDGLHRLSSLIGISFTSAAVSRELLQRVNRDLRLLFFMVTYGSSEAGAVANGTCFLDGRQSLPLRALFKLLTRTRLLSGAIGYDDFERNPYSLAGLIDRCVDVRVQHPVTGEPLGPREEGEIAVRSHRVMRYWRENRERPSLTTDGWYRTGDLGYVEEERMLTITGRLHRLISRGGEKISPLEIEGRLLEHADIVDAFALGIHDELYGEQICACVVLRQDAALGEQDVRLHLSTRLSAFKMPQYLIILPELPLSPTGKVAVPDITKLALARIGERRRHA
ncbi:class I adenylate-forming enzyme family protein [Paenibacillus aurantiacus]|uniref:Class I adenylate-forming enzyme family protein n=1 Tax=Paenibacillus aurantiacus TaxID=1936118 RepID=A0ABV5KN84_9BACL